MVKLERVVPESVGISSKSLHEYIGKLNAHDCHSVMVMRHGKVVKEAWWAPYKPEYNHVVFSMSKSFVSVAIGFAQKEGILDINNRVIDYFPEYFPSAPCVNMQEVRIRDLLRMGLGHRGRTDIDFYYEPDWLTEILHLYLDHKPSSNFYYDNRCTFLCSVILTKLTGKTVFEYLKPRLFDKLGFENIWWEQTGAYNYGGWGLNLKTEEIAAFGQFLLNKGNWNGEQLLDPEWIREATAKQIENQGLSVFDWADWEEGYGYYFWQCVPDKVYRGDGAFGQFVIVAPNEDMVVAITAGSDHQCSLLEDTWKLLAEVNSGCLEENDESQLKDMDDHQLPVVNGMYSVPTECEGVSGKTYIFPKNKTKIEKMTLEFGETDRVAFVIDGDTFAFDVGHGSWIETDTRYRPEAFNSLSTLFFSNVAACGAWKDSHYYLKLAYTRTSFVDTIDIEFCKNAIKLKLTSYPALFVRHEVTEIFGIEE